TRTDHLDVDRVGKGHAERRADAHLTLEGDAASLELDDPSAQGETQTGARGFVPAIVEALEPAKDSILVFRGDADPGAAHHKQQIAARNRRGEPDPPPPIGELRRVRTAVGQDLSRPAPVEAQGT